MLKINKITFTGIEKNQKTKNSQQNITPPETKELGEKALPTGDKSLAISPTLQSDFINDSDLIRYEKVQKEWGESLAKRLNIPAENVLSKIPKVKIAEPEIVKNMLSQHQMAYFDSYSNQINLNPIREMLNQYGDDETKIVHESTHGFFHNLRATWSHKIPQENLISTLANTVEERIKQGEQDFIISELRPINQNGQMVLQAETMSAPILSKEERGSILETIDVITDEHLIPQTTKLNDLGKELVKEKLIPKITEYPKHLNKKDNTEILNRMCEYIESFYARRNFLTAILLNNKYNNNCELSHAEEILAKKSLDGLLSTYESNFAIKETPLGMIDNVNKNYFMSFEEKRARKEENLYRKIKIKNKIAEISSKGLKPSETLLKEQQTVQNNLKLLKLTSMLKHLESQIIAAPKSADKIFELNTIWDNISECFENETLISINKNIDINEFNKAGIINYEDIIKYLEQKLPKELKPKIPECIDIDKKIKSLTIKLNELNRPVALLEDTPENIKLKDTYENIIKQIRKLAFKCDISAIPKQFFNSQEEQAKSAEKFAQCCAKWAKRIL